MDSLLAGNLILPWRVHFAGYDVQRRRACRKLSGHRENHSGLGRKLFAFAPESLFAFSPESCSSSPRNRFRVHPGILFAFARNPQRSSVGVFIRPPKQARLHHMLEVRSIARKYCRYLGIGWIASERSADC
jgi:hypothetical protein